MLIFTGFAFGIAAFLVLQGFGRAGRLLAMMVAVIKNFTGGFVGVIFEFGGVIGVLLAWLEAKFRKE